MNAFTKKPDLSGFIKKINNDSSKKKGGQASSKKELDKIKKGLRPSFYLDSNIERFNPTK